MSNPEHEKLLLECCKIQFPYDQPDLPKYSGTIKWNKFRAGNPNLPIDLSEMALGKKDMTGMNFINVNFQEAKIGRCSFHRCNLRGANFSRVVLKRNDYRLSTMDAHQIGWLVSGMQINVVYTQAQQREMLVRKQQFAAKRMAAQRGITPGQPTHFGKPGQSQHPGQPWRQIPPFNGPQQGQPIKLDPIVERKTMPVEESNKLLDSEAKVVIEEDDKIINETEPKSEKELENIPYSQGLRTLRKNKNKKRGKKR